MATEAPAGLETHECAKYSRVIEIVAGVPLNRRTIVFCVYRYRAFSLLCSTSHARRQTFEQVQRVVETRLGRKVFCLHGGVPKTQRNKIIQEWEETNGAVLCAQLFVAGVGLNLQKMCNTAIFLLRWFNVPMETQVPSLAGVLHVCNPKRRPLGALPDLDKSFQQTCTFYATTVTLNWTGLTASMPKRRPSSACCSMMMGMTMTMLPTCSSHIVNGCD